MLVNCRGRHLGVSSLGMEKLRSIVPSNVNMVALTVTASSFEEML